MRRLKFMWEMLFMINEDQRRARIYEVGSIIKFVTTLNVEAVCNVATRLLKQYEIEDIEEMDNQRIYEEYCRVEEGV